MLVYIVAERGSGRVIGRTALATTMAVTRGASFYRRSGRGSACVFARLIVRLSARSLFGCFPSSHLLGDRFGLCTTILKPDLEDVTAEQNSVVSINVYNPGPSLSTSRCGPRKAWYATSMAIKVLTCTARGGMSS